VVELHHSVVGPKLVPDFLARHHLARTLEKHPQNLKGLILQPDLGSVLAEFGGSQIEFERAETDIGGLAAGPAGFSSPLHLRIPRPCQSGVYHGILP
jgi:hypothetical protein